MKSLFFCIISTILFTSCSQKLNIESYQPAKIDRVSKTKKIAVLKFDNDDIGFTSALESNLAKKKVYDKQYFTIISRNQLDNILKEQKFQYSGLVDKDSSVKIGKIIGVQSLISGNITDSSLSKSYYNESRFRCLDKKCQSMREYFVRCTKANYNLSVSIKMTDIEYGDIIYADTSNRTSSYSHCSDYSRGLPNQGQVISNLSESIINDFISKISPTKINIEVELLDSPEIDYNDKQDKLLEHSLEYIKNGRFDKAEQLLSELLTSTNDKCFVASYNLGIVKEIQGEYELAKQLYNLADSLIIEPNEALDKAVLRIEKQLENKNIVKSQIEN